MRGLLWVGPLAFLVCLALLGSEARADPTIQELEKQVKQLEKQRDQQIKFIQGVFDRIIKGDKLQEKELEQHRNALIKERGHLLKQASTEEQRKIIHEHFDPIIRRLEKREKLDEATIAELRKQRDRTVKFVRAEYNAAIKALKDQITALKHHHKPQAAPKTQPGNKPGTNPPPTKGPAQAVPKPKRK
jgi:hypothetical protein